MLSVHSYWKIEIIAIISSIPHHIRRTDEHPIKCLILWVVEVAWLLIFNIKRCLAIFIFRMHFKWIEYIFSSHINTIPKNSAELRSKRQTELETWGMVPNAGPDIPETRHEYIIRCADKANPFLSVIRMAWWWQPLKTEGSQCLECLCEWEWKIVATELLCGFTRFPCTEMCNVQYIDALYTLHCKDTVCNNLTRFAMPRGAGKWWKPQWRQSTTISSKCTHRTWCPLWIWS